MQIPICWERSLHGGQGWVTATGVFTLGGNCVQCSRSSWKEKVQGTARVPSLLVSDSWVVPVVMEVLHAWHLTFPWPGATWDFPTSHPAGVNRALFALWASDWWGWRRCSAHQPGAYHGPHLPFAGLSLCTLNSLNGAHHTLPGKGLFPADGSWQHWALRYCHLRILPAFSCCSCWCNLSGQGRW